MNFFTMVFLFGSFVCSTYGIANDEPMQSNIKKEVPIYNKWNEFKKRMVWIPKHAEFVRHRSDLQPASEEAYKIMVHYQEKLETTDTTCTILNDPSVSAAAYNSANTESVSHCIDRILFSQSYPLNSVRIANFQSIIDEIRKQ
jgi:nitric oxide reductase activation protein